MDSGRSFANHIASQLLTGIACEARLRMSLDRDGPARSGLYFQTLLQPMTEPGKLIENEIEEFIIFELIHDLRHHFKESLDP